MRLLKRGAAHFEMVIAFVLFVGFVLFLFTILQPYEGDTLSGAVIEGVYESFTKIAGTNLTELFIEAEYSGAGCFYVNLPEEIFDYPFSNSVVTSSNGEDIGSSINSGGALNLNKSVSFFNVKVSPDFVDDAVSSCTLVSDYNLGGIYERKVLSEDKIAAMETLYYNDYESLKNLLKVPPLYDFAISSTSTGVKLGAKVPDSGDVLAKDFIAEVLYINGTVINERFNFRIW